MRIAVTGGRDYDDSLRVRNVIRSYCSPGDTLVHGGARGADLLCAYEAVLFGLKVEMHAANWRERGRSAGPLRNQEMIDSGVDLLLAFPGGRGTKDMVRRARMAGVKVVEIA